MASDLAVRVGVDSGLCSENSKRLRFDTKDDALNYARKIAEDGRRWPLGELARAFEGQNEDDFYVPIYPCT